MEISSWVHVGNTNTTGCYVAIGGVDFQVHQEIINLQLVMELTVG